MSRDNSQCTALRELGRGEAGAEAQGHSMKLIDMVVLEAAR